MQILSSAFQDNAHIPVKYTCRGENVNPPLVFKGIPTDAVSVTLIIEDPDAPRPNFTHWIVFNLPPDLQAIAEDSNPPGLIGTNSFGQTNYGGPCPPSGIHRYFFHLYALDKTLNLAGGATKENVRNSMRDHIIDFTDLVGLFSAES